MIKTSCKECYFAIYDNNIQTGCEFNRLDKFKKTLEKDDKSYYVLERFCNRCISNKSKFKTDDPRNEVEIKTRAKVGLFFNIQSTDEKYLKKVCELLNPLYFSPAVTYFMNGTGVHHSRFKDVIENNFKLNYKITTYNSEVDYAEILFPLLIKERLDFFISTDNQYIPHNIISNLDYAFNEDLLNIGVFKYKGFEVYSVAVAKALYNGFFINYVNEITETVKEMNPEMICIM